MTLQNTVNIDSLNASWVWSDALDKIVNQFIQFRHEFELDYVNADASLIISSETNYVVWINGIFIDCGQYHDYPSCKTYDVLAVGDALKVGKNVIAVYAYHQGEDSFQYIPDEPGIVYSLKCGDKVVSSGNETLCRVSPCYKNGEMPRINRQLGFTFEYNASCDDNWQSFDYVAGSDWQKALIIDSKGSKRGVLHKRPIKKLEIEPIIKSTVISQGVFIRKYVEDVSVAMQMQTDFLSPKDRNELFADDSCSFPSENGIIVKSDEIKDNSGAYIIIDLGREDAGIFEMDIESSEGTLIDVAHGEHLDDLRVRSHVGGRNFANRYITKNGRHKFVNYFNRIACRYIQLQISNIKSDVKIYYVGLYPTVYPFETVGSFDCSDSLHNKIFEVSKRTLQLCMHEHFEDCPWREQSLYAMDSRNQAMASYYLFGTDAHDFAAASFDLLGNGLEPDGYLELCAPARIEITIPVFSMAWISSIADNLKFSGNIEYAKKWLPQINDMLKIYENSIVGGLLPSPIGERYWHFYEWADGMNGKNMSFAKTIDENGPRFDAPLNLFYCLALESAAFIAQHCGEDDLAKDYLGQIDRLRKSIHKRFWDKDNNIYFSFSNDKQNWHTSELTQALALLANIVPKKYSAKLREKLSQNDNGMVGVTLSHAFYKYDALLMEPESYGQTVFDDIKSKWGYMLYNNATSFWETIKGADDFANAGSLCHGWSAIPIIYYFKYILGIVPIEPGFIKCGFEPLDDIFNDSSGFFHTTYGQIDIELSNNGDYSVTTPIEINLVD